MEKIFSYNLVLNKHVKPRNSEEFGYWLAGLIDADGHINPRGHLSIEGHIRDLSVMYYIKKILASGSIYKHKKVNACRYTCASKQSLRLCSNLLFNKLRLPGRIDQFNTRLVPRVRPEYNEHAVIPDAICLNNHWFAGFTQGDGSFQVRIRKPHKRFKKNQVEIGLVLEIKHEYLLRQIQSTFGGGVYYRKSRDTYIYRSNNLKNASKLVSYFDVYQVIGSSYRIYLLWRAALRLVLEKAHLTEHGIQQIGAIQDRMKRLKGTHDES